MHWGDGAYISSYHKEPWAHGAEASGTPGGRAFCTRPTVEWCLLECFCEQLYEHSAPSRTLRLSLAWQRKRSGGCKASTAQPVVGRPVLAIRDGLEVRGQVTVSQSGEEPFVQSGLHLPILWPQAAKDVRKGSSHLIERER